MSRQIWCFSRSLRGEVRQERLSAMACDGGRIKSKHASPQRCHAGARRCSHRTARVSRVAGAEGRMRRRSERLRPSHTSPPRGSLWPRSRGGVVGSRGALQPHGPSPERRNTCPPGRSQGQHELPEVAHKEGTKVSTTREDS